MPIFLILLYLSSNNTLFLITFNFFISPEGCAAILWKDGTKANEAAESLNLTSKRLYELKLIDNIIKEPLGGAHRNWHDVF